jgi:hypothetical protein
MSSMTRLRLAIGVQHEFTHSSKSELHRTCLLHVSPAWPKNLSTYSLFYHLMFKYVTRPMAWSLGLRLERSRIEER